MRDFANIFGSSGAAAVKSCSGLGGEHDEVSGPGTGTEVDPFEDEVGRLVFMHTRRPGETQCVMDRVGRRFDFRDDLPKFREVFGCDDLVQWLVERRR